MLNIDLNLLLNLLNTMVVCVSTTGDIARGFGPAVNLVFLIGLAAGNKISTNSTVF